ncbi:hypothetical protein GYMLUDRAFT_287717 [Collybiopsis luxurians FD-317 M1]|nr:hypothetical protein GYMLUDRAFT_287717 [Collybiopsis luxurians FD-317 M1]
MSIGLGLGSDSLVVSESQLSAPLKIAGGSSLRSASSMQGLLLAEKGEAMVELVAGNGTSGFKEGTRINPGSITPRRHTFSAMEHGRSFEKTSLSRHGTLLSSNVTPGQNAAELKSLLGNSNARLRPGASIAPLNALSSESTSLEQAKRRARVEVDVIPETNVFVQGGYINGAVKIRIRPRSKTESGILISDGKIRVVGFECILNEEKRHTFYQQSALLSEASPAAISLYDSPPDNEGFYAAKDGVHVFPFSMYLTLEGGEGAPKGTLPPHAGIAVRYILMISVKVREIETDRRSIAHFYRDCEIWPRLNPSAILSPAAEPVRESAAKTFFMGGSGKVGLTASMHRLIWVAGQRCSIKVRVINKSKKTLKSLTLTLLRSTVIYKPNPQLDVDGSNEHDADACQTSTVQKSLAENVLQMGQRDRGRGHASAKGWWTGIGPDETREFYFFLSLPSDAITIPRAHLLEVAYKVRVTISAGTLASDLHVLLPIRIINFLSIDPPPTFPPEIDDIFEENANAAHTLGRRGLESLSEDDAKNNEM